jgi:hypothetical protein
LSADRANTSRRELIAGGMNPEKVLRVVGVGPVVPLDKSQPLDPMNRRIAIVVLNPSAELRILRGSELSIEEAADLGRALAAKAMAAKAMAEKTPLERVLGSGAPAEQGAATVPSPPAVRPVIDALAIQPIDQPAADGAVVELPR